MSCETPNVTGYHTEDAYQVLRMITEPMEHRERLAVLDLAEGIFRVRECDSNSFGRFWTSLGPARQAAMATAAVAAIPTDRSLADMLAWLPTPQENR